MRIQWNNFYCSYVQEIFERSKDESVRVFSIIIFNFYPLIIIIIFA